MEDQISTIETIIDASKARDLATAQRLVRQLNAVAEERGFGKDYWLRFCESMIEGHKILAS